MTLDPPAIPPELVRRLRRASQVVVLTGAGISAESGIPTFRDAMDGLWARFGPEEVASREAFRRAPEQVWDWYAQRRAKISEARPNAGHFALAELERRLPGFLLATQNIDDLHRQAGSRRIVELHGNIHRLRCFDHDHPASTEQWGSAADASGGGGELDPLGQSHRRPPCCRRCGSLLRPDVVWFGETLDIGHLRQVVAALRQADLFLSIGTSALVEPAASLAYEAAARGASLVEINPEATPLTASIDFALRGRAGLVLPVLLEAVWPGTGSREIDRVEVGEPESAEGTDGLGR